MQIPVRSIRSVRDFFVLSGCFLGKNEYFSKKIKKKLKNIFEILKAVCCLLTDRSGGSVKVNRFIFEYLFRPIFQLP